MKRLVVVVFATVTLVVPSGMLPAQGASDPDLAAGIQQVEEGYYDKAVITLDAVVRRWAGDAARKKDLERAHIYLGVAHVGVGRADQAKAQFRSAISLMVVQPDGKRGKIKALSVASFGFSPKVTEVFEEAKQEARAEAGEKDKKFPVALVALGAVGAVAGVAVAAKGKSGSTPTIISPTINPVSPPGGAVVQVTQMTFSANNPSGFLDPTWDFGDGTTASGLTATHVFGTEGTFTIRFSAGGHSASVSVVARSLTGRWVGGTDPEAENFDLTQQGPALRGVWRFPKFGSLFTSHFTGQVRPDNSLTLMESDGCKSTLAATVGDSVNQIAGTRTITQICEIGDYPRLFRRQ